MGEQEKYCLNCGKKLKDNFCSRCGQTAHTSRISFSHLAEELQYGLFHINKGLIYTIKELLLSPGETVKNYLAGKRVRYSKPFIFLIVCGVIYSLVFHFFHFFPMEEMNKYRFENNIILEYVPLYELYANHYSLMLLLLTPFYAFFSYLLFYKRGYNYVEHLVLLSYVSGARIIILLLFYPLIYLSGYQGVYILVNVLAEIYFIWGISQFFKVSSWFSTISKVLLIIVFAVLSLVVVVVCVFLILRHYNTRI